MLHSFLTRLVPALVFPQHSVAIHGSVLLTYLVISGAAIERISDQLQLGCVKKPHRFPLIRRSMTHAGEVRTQDVTESIPSEPSLMLQKQHLLILGKIVLPQVICPTSMISESKLNSIFSATSHGKGACDGLGRTVKRLAAPVSLQRPYNDQLMTPRQLFDWACTSIPAGIVAVKIMQGKSNIYSF